MARDEPLPFDVVVVGAGPAGVVAALRAARLGAATALVTRDDFGGMAANDGPVPVRTLAQAARLIREARHLPAHGIVTGEISVDYRRLLERVQQVTREARDRSLLRDELEEAGVAVFEHAGTARFVGPTTIESETAPPLRGEEIVLCTGGVPRRLDVPGGELAATHSDAWGLSETPGSMIVIGAGATGAQVASIFNAFGTRVCLFEAAPRLLMTEDEDVSAAFTGALRELGIEVRDDGGTVLGLERCDAGVRLSVAREGVESHLEAELAVVAIGWLANTADLQLEAAGVETDRRGFVAVDDQMRTSAPHVFAAGDITGRAMLVHEAMRQGYTAATNAAGGKDAGLTGAVSPVGSFTDPEYASVGMTEAAAREGRDVLVARVAFEAMPRPIIDGRTTGFCKLIVDRDDRTILGCHIVGERAVELAQLAAVAMEAGMRVDQLARVPFSFPTYANALSRAAIVAAGAIDPDDAVLPGPE